jgi:hypothetical protein
MDQGITSEVASNVVDLGGKAWTAYAGTLTLAFFSFFLTPLLFSASWLAALLFLIVWAAGFGYRILDLKSYNLYYDDVGIWLYRGVLPWKKGVIGVKWRDLDEVVYFQTLWSWMFRSWTVKVGHRFTKTSEIIVTHLRQGQNSVQTLNARHQELIRNNVLT